MPKALVLAAVLALLTGCRSSPPMPLHGAGPPRLLRSDELTADIGQALRFATPDAFDPLLPLEPLTARASGAGFLPAAFVRANQATHHAFSVIDGVAIGVSGFVLTHQVSVIVGLGTIGGMNEAEESTELALSDLDAWIRRRFAWPQGR